MVRALTCGAEGPRIEITFDQVSGKLSLFTLQQMGTRLSLELGKVQAAKGEEMGTTLHMLCPVTHMEP